MELADYNHINEKYLDIKLQMIKQEKLPFQPDDFVGGENPLQRRATMTGNRATELAKQTDKFLSTLGKGFGAAAADTSKDRKSIGSPMEG